MTISSLNCASFISYCDYHSASPICKAVKIAPFAGRKKDCLTIAVEPATAIRKFKSK